MHKILACHRQGTATERNRLPRLLDSNHNIPFAKQIAYRSIFRGKIYIPAVPADFYEPNFPELGYVVPRGCPANIKPFANFAIRQFIVEQQAQNVQPPRIAQHLQKFGRSCGVSP
ncbi:MULTISPECIES: hypothetical protein [Mesorhizobium]|uniref:LysR substrate-binding domain-containing protein n=2 Tax=Mesorhizobium TaxID=68287 RepID=A0AB38TLP3_9HYPH|nr:MULTISPECIES: hypothetical protein [Mesorhizobium]MDF3218181.1 hypothetical protein [Mesorhizobium ciceri]UTU55339.1 hypothetical protein LRP29_32030 [Mesorhizobium ciceri]